MPRDFSAKKGRRGSFSSLERTSMIDVELRGVTRRYDQVTAVDNISLDVAKGEFLSFLGPSGCGKTTTLRMIAGFEDPDEGSIAIKGHQVNNVPPYMRNIGMVFQNYALFPHKTVFDNVAYGLKMRRLDKAEIKRRVDQGLAMVKLPGFERRKPNQLSGGQQQRIALARALVIEPDVLLLDEPLSNLDAKLREGMRIETKRIQQELGITTIYVTHDQVEAMAMSDRIAIMEHGRIVQIGSPHEIYESPANSFVADFMGQSNELSGTVTTMGQKEALVTTKTGLSLSATTRDQVKVNQEVKVFFRIGTVQVVTEKPSSAQNVFEGLVEAISYQGDSTLFYVRLEDGTELVAEQTRRKRSRRPPAEGSKVWVAISPEDCIVLAGGDQDEAS